MKDNRFKNASGVFFTKELFFETKVGDRSNAVYTLKDYDHTVDGILYPSLSKIYLEEEDLTEYDFAEKYLGGYPHWEKLLASPMISPYIKDWRKRLDLKMRAKALNRIKKKAESPEDKESFQANKFILSGQWRTAEEKSAVGRPTKAKIKEEADRIIKEQSVFDEDYDRIMNNIN